MLRIYSVVIEMLREMRPVRDEIGRRDADLARQLSRCSQSVALNLAEGFSSGGKNRTARYQTALGSMRETSACLDVGEALGYLRGVDPELLARMNHITGTLVRLVKR